jgi:2-polyprenyl-3-methyl-5-hydroxy-6-metoxy-1,4-benzoquinol methylase
MSSNQQTVQSYNDHVQEYINGTPRETTEDWKRWIDENLQALGANAKILEFGSAFGRDAAYMESQGFTMQRTDASSGFVDLLNKQGHNAQLLNAITDPIPTGYDMIFASAVLLHFTREETKSVIDKVYAALPGNGRFVFSLKIGDGEETTEAKLGAPRYFCYWQAPDIEKVLNDAGFSSVKIVTAGDYRSDKPYWLLISAAKGAGV